MGIGSNLAVEQEEEKFREDARAANAERAAMLMHFRSMSEGEAISLALREVRVLASDYPGPKEYDEEGNIIANLAHPEVQLPFLTEQPSEVQEKVLNTKEDLLSQDMIPDLSAY